MAQEGPRDMMGGFHGEIDVVAIDTDGNEVADPRRAAGPRHRAARPRRRNADGRLDRERSSRCCPAPHGGFLNVFAEDPAERMADRLIALMGGTEAGRVEIAALAERRVTRSGVADADRDAALSPEEIEASPTGSTAGPGPGTSAAAAAGAAATTTTARAGERDGVRRREPARARRQGRRRPRERS